MQPRFADSHGYSTDRMRDMSPYRDWVIRSFNQNMPYSDFIHQQLAGDLMKGPGNSAPDQGYAHCHSIQQAAPAEWGRGELWRRSNQTEYVMDRANTVGDAFMAISFGCARCHDHKYDPVSHKKLLRTVQLFQ
jgi:hypothetical protein